MREIACQVERHDATALVKHGASCRIGVAKELDNQQIGSIVSRHRNAKGHATRPILHGGTTLLSGVVLVILSTISGGGF
jgi:hypothetical protein